MSRARAIAGCDGEVRALQRGQVATFESGGGFVRRPAPDHGVLFDLRETSLFVRAADLQAALHGRPFQDGRLEIRLCKRGEKVPRAVPGGGFVRKELEADALVIGTSTTVLLLPAMVGKKLLAELPQDRTTGKEDRTKQPEQPEREIGR